MEVDINDGDHGYYIDRDMQSLSFTSESHLAEDLPTFSRLSVYRFSAFGFHGTHVITDEATVNTADFNRLLAHNRSAASRAVMPSLCPISKLAFHISLHLYLSENPTHNTRFDRRCERPHGPSQ